MPSEVNVSYVRFILVKLNKKRKKQRVLPATLKDIYKVHGEFKKISNSGFIPANYSHHICSTSIRS